MMCDLGNINKKRLVSEREINSA